MMKRKTWIDRLRGFCMLAILFDHTEIYYTGDNIVPYNFYVMNVLLLFFFLSGYLCFKKENQSWRKKLTTIFRTMLVPYLFFTTIIALPKALVHGYDITDTFLRILEGRASWFIATLMVAESLFVLAMWISKENRWIMACLSLVSMGGCLVFSKGYPDLYWQLENVLMALPVLHLGYLYHQHEAFFHPIHKLSSTFFLSLFIIFIKVYEVNIGANLLIEPIAVSHWAVFCIDFLVTTLCLIGVAKQLPRLPFLEWVGSHSLVYYFLSGGIPLTVSLLLTKIGFPYEGTYYHVCLAFFIVSILTSALTFCIYKYAPFLVGKFR